MPNSADIRLPLGRSLFAGARDVNDQPLSLRPADGHVVVIGSVLTGKSTLARTLAVSAADAGMEVIVVRGPRPDPRLEPAADLVVTPAGLAGEWAERVGQGPDWAQSHPALVIVDGGFDGSWPTGRTERTVEEIYRFGRRFGVCMLTVLGFPHTPLEWCALEQSTTVVALGGFEGYPSSLLGLDYVPGPGAVPLGHGVLVRPDGQSVRFRAALPAAA